MLLRVTKYGEPILAKKAEDVSTFDLNLKTLIEDMLETMIAENGLGLAAPQIGISQRIFVIDMRQRINKDAIINYSLDGKFLPIDMSMPLVAINPILEFLGDEISIADEGCLSFPLIFGEVKRSYAVKLNYSDINNIKHEIMCDGLFARCIQHEYDHLEGISFIDRMKRNEVLKNETKLKKLKRASRDFLKSK